METELGLKLFTRERQRLIITEQGREYLAVLRDAFDRIALGTERLKQRKSTWCMVADTRRSILGCASKKCPSLLTSHLAAKSGDVLTVRTPDATWLTVLKAAFGERLTETEREAFAAVAGERSAPESRVRELWAVVSRRGGKSRTAAAIATYLGAILDHSHRLSPGEVGFVLVLAATQRQARVIKSYSGSCSSTV